MYLTVELQCWVAVILHDSDKSTRMNFVSISRHQGVPLPANQRMPHLVVQMQFADLGHPHDRLPD